MSDSKNIDLKALRFSPLPNLDTFKLMFRYIQPNSKMQPFGNKVKASGIEEVKSEPLHRNQDLERAIKTFKELDKSLSFQNQES